MALAGRREGREHLEESTHGIDLDVCNCVVEVSPVEHRTVDSVVATASGFSALP